MGKFRRYNDNISKNSNNAGSPSSKYMKSNSSKRDDAKLVGTREWNYDGIKFRGRKFGIPAGSINSHRKHGDEPNEPNKDDYAS